MSTDSDTVHEQIDNVVKNNSVVLFMKGTPELPQCGFSQRVTSILDASKTPYSAVNVLLDERVREGIKQYSDWPTIPQLYIAGEFIGGCDIISELHENGELASLLKSTETLG